jgi:hypothetical protein
MRCGCWAGCCQCSLPGWPRRCRHTGRRHSGRWETLQQHQRALVPVYVAAQHVCTLMMCGGSTQLLFERQRHVTVAVWHSGCSAIVEPSQQGLVTVLVFEHAAELVVMAAVAAAAARLTMRGCSRCWESCWQPQSQQVGAQGAAAYSNCCCTSNRLVYSQHTLDTLPWLAVVT